MRSNEQAFFSRGELIVSVRYFPCLSMSKASPGCSSRMESTGRLKAVCMTGRSDATTTTSSSACQKAGRSPHGSRIENISPLPVTPQMTYPPSHAGLVLRRTLATSIRSSMARVSSVPCSPSAFSRSCILSASRSRRCPICSSMIYVSAYWRGCWPCPVISSKISSTLVRLKFPQRHKFFTLQLSRRKTGWTYDNPDFPVVLYRKCPIYNSPAKGV